MKSSSLSCPLLIVIHIILSFLFFLFQAQTWNNEEKIRTHFEQCGGKIVDVSIKRYNFEQPDQPHSGYGFLVFSSFLEAETAVQSLNNSTDGAFQYSCELSYQSREKKVKMKRSVVSKIVTSLRQMEEEQPNRPVSVPVSVGKKTSADYHPVKPRHHQQHSSDSIPAIPLPLSSPRMRSNSMSGSSPSHGHNNNHNHHNYHKNGSSSSLVHVPVATHHQQPQQQMVNLMSHPSYYSPSPPLQQNNNHHNHNNNHNNNNNNIQVLPTVFTPGSFPPPLSSNTGFPPLPPPPAYYYSPQPSLSPPHSPPMVYYSFPPPPHLMVPSPPAMTREFPYGGVPGAVAGGLFPVPPLPSLPFFQQHNIPMEGNHPMNYYYSQNTNNHNYNHNISNINNFPHYSHSSVASSSSSSAAVPISPSQQFVQF
jgi:hypothetical protein